MDDIVLTYDVPTGSAEAFRIYVQCTDQWWPALYSADPDRFTGAFFEPRVGGRLLGRYGEAVEEWGRVLVLEPGVQLRHTFALAHRGRATWVQVDFADHDTGCRVRLRHGGWSRDNDVDRAKFADWPLILGEYVTLVRRVGRRGA